MAEKNAEVFLVATCNAMIMPNGELLLPGELQRRGRMDAIFFAGFPGYDECKDIINIHLSKPREMSDGRDPSRFNVDEIAAVKYVSDGKEYPLTGAEWESAILDAMYIAFAQDREPTTDDIIKCVRQVKPVSYVMRETMEALYEFGTSRCLPASSRQLAEPSSNVRRTVGDVEKGGKVKKIDASSLMNESLIG